MNVITFASVEITGFNRYMVECEFSLYLLLYIIRSVLIDTWWNVNKGTDLDQYGDKDVLIDTWWNVNII